MPGFWFDRLIAGSGLRECVRWLGRPGSCEGPGGEPLSHNSSLYFTFSFYKVGVLKRFNPTFRPDKKSHSYWKGGYNTVSGASRLLPTHAPPSTKNKNKKTLLKYITVFFCHAWIRWMGNLILIRITSESFTGAPFSGLTFSESKLTRIPFLTAVCVSDEWLTQITVGHACKRMGLCYRSLIHSGLGLILSPPNTTGISLPPFLLQEVHPHIPNPPLLLNITCFLLL